MTLLPFAYPRLPHQRRHYPAGYADFHSYREWLRDEFAFRCVFCLIRERWQPLSFHIDHCIPQTERPDLVCEYANLLYVCARCNLAKSDVQISDPCALGFGECLRVEADGRITALNQEGRRLIGVLRLDNEKYTSWRKLMLETLEFLRKTDEDAFKQWMSFPNDMVDLSTLRPPSNSKREGISQSYFVLRSENKIPAVYG